MAAIPATPAAKPSSPSSQLIALVMPTSQITVAIRLTKPGSTTASAVLEAQGKSMAPILTPWDQTTMATATWPARRGQDPQAQQQQLIDWFDLARSNNFNAVVLQVRPTADTFWPSSKEPWSRWLTGTQGQDPGYDPLAFATEQAHARGLQLHAWFNPYRAHHPAGGEVGDEHRVTDQRPDRLAFDHLRKLRRRSARVEVDGNQARLRSGDRRLNEASMVSTQDPYLRATSNPAGTKPAGLGRRAVIKFTPRARTLVVDDRRPVAETECAGCDTSRQRRPPPDEAGR